MLIQLIRTPFSFVFKADPKSNHFSPFPPPPDLICQPPLWDYYKYFFLSLFLPWLPILSSQPSLSINAKKCRADTATPLLRNPQQLPYHSTGKPESLEWPSRPSVICPSPIPHSPLLWPRFLVFSPLLSLSRCSAAAFLFFLEVVQQPACQGGISGQMPFPRPRSAPSLFQTSAQTFQVEVILTYFEWKHPPPQKP